jgi:AcrR family transcriptional regulator
LRRKRVEIETSSARRLSLTTERIVAQAMRIADEHGVVGLSMRSLSRSLGFEVMALYNHVANKRDLLSLMIDGVASAITGPPQGLPPLDAVRSIAISTHTALLAHPWVTELWQQHLPGPARTVQMETLLRLLDESGLSPELAHHGFHAVNNHVIGYTLQEATMVLAGRNTTTNAEDFLAGISPTTHPYMVAHVQQHLSGDSMSSFELVLDLILDGLVRLDVTP